MAAKLTREEKYMKAAIREAKKAWALGEVPIGCVIVYEDKVIGRGYNRRMVDHSALAHAEIAAIKKACKCMGDWRLEECELYVTLEPCPMCAGAIVQARIPKVYIGSMNPKAGCAGSVLNLLDEKGFNHQVETEEGLLGEECSMMLKEFLKELREKRKKKKDFHQLFAFHISHSNRKIQSLFDYVDPALRSFDVTHLDAGQCLVEFLGNRTHLLHTCREADFLAVVNDLANRGDDSCGTAQTALCEIFYFV